MVPRICICDDDPVVSEMLSLDLRAAGLPVSDVFAGVGEARERLADARPDILLLDLHMPDGGGLDVLSFLREEGLDETTRVIVLTGEEDSYFIDEAKRLGASGYLVKPVRAADLVTKVRRLAQDASVRWIDDFSVVSREARFAPIQLAEPAAPAPARRPLQVLSVEDTAVNQQLIALYLEDQGILVDKVQTGAKALAAIRCKQYDAVLLDMHLPDMDGVEIARALRRAPPAGRRVPIIAISSDVTPEQVERARSAGVDDYVFKPFTPADLKRALQPLQPQDAPPTLETLNTTLGDLFAAYGQDAVSRLLAGLNDQLQKMTAALKDRHEAAEIAHAIKGSAAGLGFERVALACSVLEDACKSEGPFERELARAALACAVARDQIAACSSPPGAVRRVA